MYMLVMQQSFFECGRFKFITLIPFGFQFLKLCNFSWVFEGEEEREERQRKFIAASVSAYHELLSTGHSGGYIVLPAKTQALALPKNVGLLQAAGCPWSSSTCVERLLPLLSCSSHWPHSSSVPLGRLLLKDSSWQVVCVSVGDTCSYRCAAMRTELQVTDPTKHKSPGGCLGSLEGTKCLSCLDVWNNSCAYVKHR